MLKVRLGVVRERREEEEMCMIVLYTAEATSLRLDSRGADARHARQSL